MIINGSSSILSLSTCSYLNKLLTALLALKIGKENTYGSWVIQGVNKRVLKAQREITKINYIMVGHLSSVVYSPTCHCHFYMYV